MAWLCDPSLWRGYLLLPEGERRAVLAEVRWRVQLWRAIHSGEGIDSQAVRSLPTS